MSTYIVLGLAGLFLFVILVLMNYFMVSRLYSESPGRKTEKILPVIPETKEDISAGRHITEPVVPENVLVKVPENPSEHLNKDIPVAVSEQLPEQVSGHTEARDAKLNPRENEVSTADREYRQLLNQISRQGANPKEVQKSSKADAEYREAIRSMGVKQTKQ